MKLKANFLIKGIKVEGSPEGSSMTADLQRIFMCDCGEKFDDGNPMGVQLVFMNDTELSKLYKAFNDGYVFEVSVKRKRKVQP